MPDCAQPGERVTIEGINFPDRQSGRRLWLHSPGIDLEVFVLFWDSHEIRIEIPYDDPRLQPGVAYEIHQQIRGGDRPRPMPGPRLKICADDGDQPGDPAAAVRLVDEIVRASGGNNWPLVSRIRFTFNVADGNQLKLSAKHDWDVRAGTDTVAWGGKQVTVNLQQQGTEPADRAAYQRWVNDSYWLLAPLKLRDPGVEHSFGGRGRIDDQEVLLLKVRFNQVGLTPSDQYNFYVDPDEFLVRRWDYVPASGNKIKATWENYREFGGLYLATEHRIGTRRIWFTDVAVTTDAE